jgi:D-glycero-D-manno-heptose 1,7-bisphosphate phosphatase
MARPAVFLDRDGVLNQETGYNRRGIFCCLASNQSGPARNYYPDSHVRALHERLCQLLNAEAVAYLDAQYYCAHLSPPEGGKNPDFTGWTTWRKPNTGMLVAAAWEHDLDLSQSFMVGDKATDVDLAHNAGCRGILVQTGFGEDVLKGTYQHHTQPDYIAADLPAAVTWILQQADAFKK